MKHTSTPYQTRNTLIIFSLVALFATCKQDDPPSPPVAMFEYTPAIGLVAPVSVNFFNLSTNATEYFWRYDNGQSSTDKDVTLKFNSAGTYTITLIATGKGGSDTYSKTITVDAPAAPKPVADFSYYPSTNLVAPQTIIFNNASTNADSYKWDFGDGTTSNTKNPTKEYTRDGTFTIKLTATGAGTSNEKSKNITIEKAAAKTGQVVFWTAKPNGWNSIDVTVNGSLAGSITGFSTTAPACGTSKVATFTGNPGTYAFSAKSNTGVNWSGNVF